MDTSSKMPIRLLAGSRRRRSFRASEINISIKLQKFAIPFFLDAPSAFTAIIIKGYPFV
jgi:hypothetical protein